MKFTIAWLALMLVVAACKNKKKEKKETSQYFPIRSYLQSQVKTLDTASYDFIKIETANGKSDTSVLKKDELRMYTLDFLDIPDLRNAEEAKHYYETKSYDSLMGRVFMSYTSEEDDMEVTKQEITVLPTLTGSDEVKTVYIEKLISETNTTIDKKMLWEIGNFFTITTITQKNNSDQVHKLKVLYKKTSPN